MENLFRVFLYSYNNTRGDFSGVSLTAQVFSRIFQSYPELVKIAFFHKKSIASYKLLHSSLLQ